MSAFFSPPASAHPCWKYYFFLRDMAFFFSSFYLFFFEVPVKGGQDIPQKVARVCPWL